MKVLFVCSGNAYRSPVAEALLKKFRPDLTVDSAGTNPGIPISEEAVQYLAGENAEVFLKEVPEGLKSKPLEEYHLIVAMQPTQRDYLKQVSRMYGKKIVVWSIEDPYFLPQGKAEKSSVKSKIKS